MTSGSLDWQTRIAGMKDSLWGLPRQRLLPGFDGHEYIEVTNLTHDPRMTRICYPSSKNEGTGTNVSTKCCWAVGVSLEEWDKAEKLKSHYMLKSSKVSGIYRKSACGRETRKADGSAEDLKLIFAGQTAECDNCILFKKTHGDDNLVH